MSVRKLTANLFAILVILVGVGQVEAQQRFENLPPADPFAFDPDFNWFEPVYDLDLEDMKAKHRAPRGWFGTYDRLHLQGSRPESDDPQHAETKLDSGWGHRYQFGYMNMKDRGYDFTWTTASVAQSFIIRQEAANRFTNPQTSGGDGTTTTSTNNGFIRPPGAGNNLGASYRYFDVEDSENVFEYDAFEFNKTWRLEPYHYGGILEPFIGFRYMKVTDINRRDRFNTVSDITSTGTTIGILGFPADQLFRDQAITENDMIGGQFGFRYFKYRNRFTYSTDFRVFMGENFQCSKYTREETVVFYGDITDTTITIADPVQDVQFDSTRPDYTRNEQFFVGFDLRGEIGYQLTKMITVRAGVQLIDIGTGVWRGGDTRDTLFGGDRDQDLVMLGGSLGLTLNH